MDIVSIVPRLPPAIDGVGDYAINIAGALKKELSVDTHFVVGNRDSRKSYSIGTHQVDSVDCRSSNSLTKILDRFNSENSIIFLNYATRAYGYKGCPFWILKSLKKYKKRGGKIIIMFHEIHSQESHFLRSDFWMASAQKQMIKEFLSLADQSFTNCENYDYALRKLNPNLENNLLTFPVPSTVGEPSQLKPLIEREPNLVVFGQDGNRRQAYKAALEIEKICHSLNIKQILDIGPSCGAPQRVGDVPIIQLGKVDSQEISQLLMNSISGFLAYRPDRLGKSSIFASYCSHGILPINAFCHDRDTDYYKSLDISEKLVLGKHYLNANCLGQGYQLDISYLQNIVFNAHHWYATHNLSVQSKVFSDYLIRLLEVPEFSHNHE